MQKKEEKKLTPKQEKFCRLYATEKDYFGNGAQCYIEVYSTKKKPLSYKAARANASRLLTNDNILARINELMEEAILNDTFVDKQLGFLIEQHADFSSKLGAIKEYNKLKQRITEKMDLTSQGEKITGINYITPDGNHIKTNNETTPSISSS